MQNINNMRNLEILKEYLNEKFGAYTKYEYLRDDKWSYVLDENGKKQLVPKECEFIGGISKEADIIYGSYYLSNGDSVYAQINYNPGEKMIVKLKLNKGNVNKSVSKYSTAEKFVNDLIHAINIFINEHPLCSYSLTYRDFEEQNKVIEWNLKQPEERISTLMERQICSRGEIIDNLELYGNRDINNYIDLEEVAMMNRIDDGIPIYGITLYRDPAMPILSVDCLTEQELFAFINFYMNKLNKMKKLSKEELRSVYGYYTKDVEFYVYYLIYQTKRFGVEMPKLDPYRKIESKSFDEWFEYWKEKMEENENRKLNGLEPIEIPSWRKSKNKSLK